MNVPNLGEHSWALLENCSHCVLTEASALVQLGSPLLYQSLVPLQYRCCLIFEMETKHNLKSRRCSS